VTEPAEHGPAGLGCLLGVILGSAFWVGFWFAGRVLGWW